MIRSLVKYLVIERSPFLRAVELVFNSETLYEILLEIPH